MENHEERGAQKTIPWAVGCEISALHCFLSTSLLLQGWLDCL